MRDVGRTREEFVNHEPQMSDLRILESVLLTSHVVYKPINHYCFYIPVIIQKTLEISMGLPAQQTVAD